jgi:teichuronic acid biosynthesis glycosyltransferase TuaG
MPESVSVIIPTWNRAHTIRAAVESVLAQTHPVQEVLICDDGSTDDTREVLAAIGDSRVKLIEGPRAGRPAIPRNRGIREAKGDWLAFLDSDDSWRSDKLEKQFAAMKKCNTAAACSDAERIIPGKGSAGHYLNLREEQLTLHSILYVNYVICSSALVRADLVRNAGGFPETDQLTAIEDYALWLRVATRTNFAYCAEPLVNYTDDAANSIRANTREFEQRQNVMLDFYHWYKSQSPHEALAAVRKATRIAMKRNGRSLIERWKI